MLIILLPLSVSFSFSCFPSFLSPFGGGAPTLLFSPAWLCGSQLVLETYNVPELSAGVNCTFEDLSEMDGLVIGNQIQCYSPAAKEVPRIITENGEQVVPGGKVGWQTFHCAWVAELMTDVGY